MKKRKQHYVWEHYLAAWATGMTLYCDHDGRQFPASTDKVANERDFYRLKELSAEDLRYVKLLVERLPHAEARAMASNWITKFQAPFEINRKYSQGKLKNDAFEAAFDEAVNNLEEELHAKFEAEAIPLLAELKQCRASSIFDDAAGVKAAMFIALQYLRTPSMRRKIGAVNTDEIPGFDIETAWGVLRTVYSTTFAAGLYLRRSLMRVTFLHASPERGFITGDQPVVNVGDSQNEALVQLYYPLSPRLAMLLAFNAKPSSSSEVELSFEETCSYNRRMAAAADRQLYAAALADFGDVRTVGAAG